MLGVENSHAGLFLEFMRANSKFNDIEVVGVFSEDEAATKRLHDAYGIPVMKTYDELAGKVDGVINTARHGDNHYKYLKPYLEYGIPVFVDKPITCKCEDALALVADAKKYNVKLTGGSCLRHVGFVQDVKNDVKEGVDGKTHGGLVRAPLSSNNPWGGLFFYIQHLIETVLEVFGRYPKSVRAYKVGEDKNFKEGDDLTVVFRYDNYDIIALGGESVFTYHVSRCSDTNVKGYSFNVKYGGPAFLAELNEYYDILHGADVPMGYKDFIAPVFVMNAIKESLDTDQEVAVKQYEV